MYTVTVTNMQGGKYETREFSTYNKANAYFIEKCDELGYDYDTNESGEEIEQTAGGIGHDYRIELKLPQPYTITFTDNANAEKVISRTTHEQVIEAITNPNNWPNDIHDYNNMLTVVEFEGAEIASYTYEQLLKLPESK